MRKWLMFGGVILVVMILGGLFWLCQPLSGAIVLPDLPQADAARLRADVFHLTQDFHPRSGDQWQNLDRAASFVKQQLQATGARVEEQRFQVDGRSYRNFFAYFGPDAVKSGQPLLVVGAHYDSNGDVPSAVGTERYTPGADDNASGSAGLLELARMLARHPPRRPVQLAAYTLEESPYYDSPHMGSLQHAQALKAAGQSVALMLCLEMIGYYSDTPNSQHFPVPGMGWLYPTVGNTAVVVGRMQEGRAARRVKALMQGATTVPIYSINAPRAVAGIDYSDHRSFWSQGYPALMITDSAFYRNERYHRGDDTADTLDYARMAQVVTAVYAVILGY